MKQLTTEQFIEKARIVHGNRYDYSKVNYTNSKTKISIICTSHGEFQQTPNDHLSGRGCPKCASNKLKTTEEFVKELVSKIGNKYNYSRLIYKGASQKVCLICPKHGEFWMTPSNLLKGEGCPKCVNHQNYSSNEWIDKAKEIHGNKYNYSKVEYVNNSTKICIICPEHSEFWQLPTVHLQLKCGCPKCANKYSPTIEEFIDKANEVHRCKYDYSKVNYINNKTKASIICPVHGEFQQTPNSHLNGRGCPKCANNVKLTTEEFIERAKNIHGNKYDYSKVNYINTHTKVCIICPEHGEFWQTPFSHIHNKSGCPLCYNENNHLSETKVFRQLQKIFPNVEYQKNFKWLKRKSLDFYIPDKNVAIEYQGRQHFSKESYFSRNLFDIHLRRDLEKIRLCKENGVKLFHLTFEKNYVPNDFSYYPIYESLEEIIRRIK